MARRGDIGAPPGRWRVVERGRRLEVIDTLNGERVASPRAAEPAVSRDEGRRRPRRFAWGVRQTRFDGGGELATMRWFDLNGPRTVPIDAGRAATIANVQVAAVAVVAVLLGAVVVWPWLLALLVLPFQPAVRDPARQRITRWLDQAAREGN